MGTSAPGRYTLDIFLKISKIFLKLNIVAVPDAVFTSDDGPVQTSYDTPVIDLTEAGPEVVEAPLEADTEDTEDTVIDLGDSASDSLSQGGTRAAADTWHRTRGLQQH